MAGPYSELSLENVKDFMVNKGGRVTNHELVKQFKHFLTNVNDIEEARYRFKKYVNTLANISQEGGEKYLVLKRVHRVGTPLEVAEYPSPVADAQPHFPGSPVSNIQNTSNSYSPVISPFSQPSFNPVGSSSPVIPPPYRAPPPYRPPPDPGASPQFSRDAFSQEHQDLYFPRSRGSDSALSTDSNNLSYTGKDSRRSSYQDPHDLGIPPNCLSVRSSSSSSLLCSGDSSFPPLGKGSSAAPQRPKVLAFGSSNTLATTAGSFTSEPTSDVYSNSASRSSLSHAVSFSSVSSLDESTPPSVPPRRRADNKENLYPAQDAEFKFRENLSNSEPGLDCVSSGSSSCRSSMASMDDDRKISVKETTQKFNKMASDAFLISGRSSNKANRINRERDDDECPPLSSFGPEGQEWLVAAAKSDFNEILRLLKIRPGLARYRDLANGYTGLHWAAKHGRAEVIKLLYGTYHVDVNARSNGGYTPLHLAAMYNRHDAFDLLTHYGADLNLRDYSGKKPRQYQATASSTVNHVPQNRIVRRRNSLKESGGFLRIGSLNVKVRKTTEAFNSLLSRDVEARLHRSWGSSDSLPESDKDSKQMPPPKIMNLKKRKTQKKERDHVSITPKTTPASTPSVTPTATPAVTPTSHRSDSLSINMSFPSTQDSDSDSAYGFGTDWNC